MYPRVHRCTLPSKAPPGVHEYCTPWGFFDTPMYRSRSLLLWYADILADRKKKLNPKPLTATEQAITAFTRPSCFALCKHADSQWIFFPAMTAVQGRVIYATDTTTTPREADDCCKSSYGHPLPTPDIFTIYCPNGVWYMFQVMHSCESPCIPF